MTRASPTEAAVLIEGVTKRFGAMTAVDGLDLTVPLGGLYGFIGPNGAGKTTTIRMIMSILFPDRGRLAVLGRPSALEAKDRIGYLPEERGVYRKMRVGDMLAYLARLKGLRGDVRRRVQAGLERVGLAAAERKRCEELSKGMLQKVQFVGATIHEPDLLILDEPFSGLDPISMRQLRDLILEQHGRGATVIFSTHVMPQAEQICGHFVMIHRGRKVLDADLAAIERQYDSRTIHFVPLEPGADVAALAALPFVSRLTRSEHGYEISLNEGADTAEAMRQIVTAVAPARIELKRPRLEDVFVELAAPAESDSAPIAEDRLAAAQAHGAVP